MPCSDIAKQKGECPPGLVSNPISLVTRYGHTPEAEGGVVFDRCTVVDRRERPWFQLIGDAKTAWTNVNVTSTRVHTLAPALYCALNISGGDNHVEESATTCTSDTSDTSHLLAFNRFSLKTDDDLDARPCEGELLHNSICLPKLWPPRRNMTASAKQKGLIDPPHPSYLTAPPAVRNISVGRSIFVDDFLVDKALSHNVVHTFFAAEYLDSDGINPIITSDRAWENGTYARPFSGGEPLHKQTPDLLVAIL